MAAHPLDVAGFVVRRVFVPAALIVCALVMCGCQLLSLTGLEKSVVAVAIQTTDLDRLLAVGSFELDRDWNVWQAVSQADGDVTREAWRWKFVVPDPAEKLSNGSPARPDLPADLAELNARYGCLWHPKPDVNPDAWGKAVEDLKTASQAASPTALKADILLGRINLRNPHYGAKFWEKVKNANPGSSGPGIFAAAAEVYCRLCAGASGDPEAAFADAGRMLERENLPDDIRGELFRGIARKIPPKQIPGLNEVMVRHESAKQMTPVHRAAIEACVIHAWHQHREQKEGTFDADRWPDGLRTCRYSEDAALRKLFGRWTVLAKHPDAVAVLKSQRIDLDLGVREEAVLSLGLLDWNSARGELLAAMEKGTEPERAAAIVGLARGGSGEILRFVREDSPRVRVEVAKQLSRFPSRSAGVTLAELLGDRSPDVQAAALASCDQPSWQDHGRLPLLLQALKVGVLRTQIAALAALRREWGAEPEFPLNGTPEERAAAVRKLAVDHQVSSEVFTAFTSAERSTPEPTAVEQTPSAVIHQLVRSFLAAPAKSDDGQKLAAELSRLDAVAVPIIEQELLHAAGPRAEEIYRTILPQRHAGYAAAVSLEATDPVLRRQAARELRLAAERGSLSPVLLARLAGPLTAEQDRQVWQEVLSAIQPDAAPEAARLALIALNSPWPDLRNLGCGYFERHPQPEYTAWLLPRLQDADRQVRMRAVQVLGACGNPAALDGYGEDETASGLRQLLTETDAELRWETVIAMSRLGDAQASQELVRQSYDPHPRQREQAIIAMGETGQRRFLEHLLRRSWTETDHGVQTAVVKSLERLVPPEDRPGLAPDAPISDKIRSWANWWERQRSDPVSARRSGKDFTEGS